MAVMRDDLGYEDNANGWRDASEAAKAGDAERLKTLIERRGLSRRQVARRAGYTDPTPLARIINRRAGIGRDTALRLAPVLGVTPAVVLGLEPLEESERRVGSVLTPDEQTILDVYRTLRQDREELLRAVISIITHAAEMPELDHAVSGFSELMERAHAHGRERPGQSKPDRPETVPGT